MNREMIEKRMNELMEKRQMYVEQLQQLEKRKNELVAEVIRIEGGIRELESLIQSEEKTEEEE